MGEAAENEESSNAIRLMDGGSKKKPCQRMINAK